MELKSETKAVKPNEEKPEILSTDIQVPTVHSFSKHVIKFPVHWDVPRFTTLSHLFAAEINLEECQQELSEKKQQSSVAQKELDEQWKEVAQKKNALKTLHNEFDKLDSKGKKERLRNKIANNIKEQIYFECKIDNIKHEVEYYQNIKNKMEKYVTMYNIFEKFLERVIAETKEFSSTKDIITRYETLSKVNTEFTEELHNGFKYMEYARRALEDITEESVHRLLKKLYSHMQQENSSKIRLLNNKLVELQMKARKVTAKKNFWEMLLNRVKMVIAQKNLELEMVKSCCWNLYKQICEQQKIPASADADLEKQILHIQKSLIYYKEVVSVATNKAKAMESETHRVNSTISGPHKP